MARTGFFAGSFDPPTHGHLDLVGRALAVVDRLVVGIGLNADKASWLPVASRLELLQQLVPPGVEVVTFDGLAVVAARKASATVLVRGVRGSADVATELAMARANRHLDPGLETILLPASGEVTHISSRLVREVARSGGDVGLFVPELVVAALARRGQGTPRQAS